MPIPPIQLRLRFEPLPQPAPAPSLSDLYDQANARVWELQQELVQWQSRVVTLGREVCAR